MNNQNHFLVCVRCFTFNHAPYIKDAMDGFCMQQTSFPYICVIVDDASTDGEQEVIKSYLDQNFNLDNQEIVKNEDTDDFVMTFVQHKTNANCFFAVYYLKYNHYSIKKDKFPYFTEYHDNAKYIALCEGDDYWINPNKLQLQVDYLDNNDSCLLCYGKGKCYIQSKQFLSDKVVGKDFVSFEQLILSNTVSTMTTLIRSNAYNKYIQEKNTWGKKQWRMGDFPIWLWCSLNGECRFFDEIFGVYRILDESASHSKNVNQQISFVLSFKEIQLFFINKYCISSRIKYKVLSRDSFTLLKLYLRAKSYKVIHSFSHLLYYTILYLGTIIFEKEK